MVPGPKAKRYFSYKLIASTLNLSVNEVDYICRKALLRPKKIPVKKRIRMLDQEHVDFLINPHTLELWSGMTMKTRTIRFHRQFPDKRIAVTSLRRLYLKHGIRRKKVR